METRITIHPAAINNFAEKSWIFSYEKLWFKFDLNEHEIELIKTQFHLFYSIIPPEEFSEKAEEFFDKLCKEITSYPDENNGFVFNNVTFIINQITYKAV